MVAESEGEECACGGVSGAAGRLGREEGRGLDGRGAWWMTL